MKKVLSLSLAVLLAVGLLGCTGFKGADGLSSATPQSRSDASQTAFHSSQNGRELPVGDVPPAFLVC